MVLRTLFLLMVCLGTAFAQSSDDVARETQRLKTQIDEEKRGASADSLRQSQWKAQSRDRLAALRADSRRLARERDSLRGELQVASRPKPPPPPVAPATVRKKAFSEALAREIEATLPLLGKPRKDDNASEVHARWTDLVQGLRSGKSDPDDALSKFIDDLSERLEQAGRIQVRAGNRTDSSGRTEKGAWIDIGLSLQAFVSNDASTAVVTVRATDQTIRLSPEQVRGLVRSGKILQGQAAPAWLVLPTKEIQP